MSSARNSAADMLKSVSIFGVVWIHSFTLNNSRINGQEIADYFRVSVPIFIILWAYFYEQGLRQRPVEKHFLYIKIRMAKLGFPFLIWSIVYLSFFDLTEIKLSTLINGHFGGYGWPGQYFFIILFQWTLLFHFLRGYISFNSTVLIVLSSIGVYWWASQALWQIEIIRKLDHRLFIYWLPYISVGILLAKDGIPNIAPFLRVALIGSVILVPIEFDALRTSNTAFSPYVMPSILISSISIVLAVLSVKSFKLFPSMFRIVGNNTFGIFLINPLVIWLVGPHLENIMSATNIPLVDNFGSTLVIFLISLTASLTIKKAGIGVIIGD